MRLSQVSPYMRSIQPSRCRASVPRCRCRDTRPPVTPSPYSWVAASSSPQLSPARKRPVAVSTASISAFFIGPESITNPSSHIAWPGRAVAAAANGDDEIVLAPLRTPPARPRLWCSGRSARDLVDPPVQYEPRLVVARVSGPISSPVNCESGASVLMLPPSGGLSRCRCALSRVGPGGLQQRPAALAPGQVFRELTDYSGEFVWQWLSAAGSSVNTQTMFRLDDGTLVLAATDLTNHLACAHLTQQRLRDRARRARQAAAGRRPARRARPRPRRARTSASSSSG